MNPILQSLAPGLFYAEGDVGFIGVQLQTRMSIVQLDNDALWVCSPLPISDEIANALDSIGRVAHVVSPNKMHNQGLDGFHERYPQAKIWAAPGLPERRPDLEYAGVLGDRPEAAWAGQLDQRVTEGNVFFSEVVFFHSASKTLIVADLVENITASTLPGGTGRAGAKMMKIYGRALASPEFRMYTTDAEAARRKLAEINGWPFERILLAHGDLITEDAHGVFEAVIEHLYAEVTNRPAHRRALYEALAKRQ